MLKTTMVWSVSQSDNTTEPALRHKRQLKIGNVFRDTSLVHVYLSLCWYKRPLEWRDLDKICYRQSYITTMYNLAW